MTEKKAWQTPELIIIGRVRSEERVLEVCKTSDPVGLPPGCNQPGGFGPTEMLADS